MVVMDPDLYRDFLTHLKERGYSALKYYRGVLNRFSHWLSSKSLSLAQVTPTVLNDYLCFRRSLGRRPGPCFYALRPFFRYALGRGKISQDPTQGVFCSWVDIPGGYQNYQGVLRRILERPGSIRGYILSLFAPDLDLYVEHLLNQGYSKRHVLGVLQYNRQFHRFLVRRGIKGLTQVTPTHVETFQRHRRRSMVYRERRPSSTVVDNTEGYIVNFLRYAFGRRGQSFRPLPAPPRFRVIPEDLLKGYLDFGRVHQGLKAITQQDQRQELLRLGRFLNDRGRRKIQEVTLQDLDAYCMTRAKTYSVPMKPVGVLRSFLRYLYLQGTIQRNLAQHIQSPCSFSANTRPKYLPWHKIQTLLAAVDRRDAGGKRNYAILALLAYHGLRAREAASLRITDIDWNDNSFLLRERKNGDTTHLPLSTEAGQALKEYLAVRPVCPAPEVFLTTYAPIKPLGRYLYAVAHRQIYKHLGRLLPQQGAYVLRHSFAKLLLDRGASLPAIGALLGHKSIHATYAYTRIASEDMREVADNYAALLFPEDPV